MNETQAQTLRVARDSYVKRMSRCTKAFLAIEYRHDLADRGQSVLYGGPDSKDELISALVELHYPRVKMNESIHVLYHQEFTNDVCEWCNPNPCPACGALAGCEYVDGLGPVVNGRHAELWDLAKPACRRASTMPEPTCDCFALETCEQCYVPPAHLPLLDGPKNLWDLPIFNWAWTEDGKDRNA